jgi:hypothetical protein
MYQKSRFIFLVFVQILKAYLLMVNSDLNILIGKETITVPSQIYANILRLILIK